MLAVADQTAEPNGLTFFEGTHRYPGSNIYAKKDSKFKKSSTGNAGHFS